MLEGVGQGKVQKCFTSPLLSITVLVFIEPRFEQRNYFTKGKPLTTPLYHKGTRVYYPIRFMTEARSSHLKCSSQFPLQKSIKSALYHCSCSKVS